MKFNDFPPSPDFDTAAIYNSQGVELGDNTAFGQDVFYSVILKGWVPHDGLPSQSPPNHTTPET